MYTVVFTDYTESRLHLSRMSISVGIMEIINNSYNLSFYYDFALRGGCQRLCSVVLSLFGCYI